MSQTNRRHFIQKTGMVAGVTAFSLAASTKAAGANERLRVGLIGCGGRGGGAAKNAMAMALSTPAVPSPTVRAAAGRLSERANARARSTVAPICT